MSNKFTNHSADDDTTAHDAVFNRSQETISLAKSKRVMIAAAESCTGGLLMASLTQIAGSSAVIDRGFVTYTNQSKTDMLGIPVSLMEQYGAVSEPVAAAMAKGALSKSDADIAVSITGIAGPGGGTKEKPVGSVCFGFAYYADDRNKIIAEHILKLFTPPLDFERKATSNQSNQRAMRSFVREQSVLFALDLICDHCNLKA